MSFIPGVDHNLSPAPGHWVLAVTQQQLLVVDGNPLIPYQLIEQSGALSSAHNQFHYLGLWQGSPCHLMVFEQQQWPEAWLLTGLRALLETVDNSLFHLAARALQLSHWLEHHRFCGRCGKPTQLHALEQAMLCNSCDALYFPRISPCVIGLVWRNSQILLARNARFKPGRFSVLAGFIEPGETAEQALAREVKEEVGIEIQAIEYLCSQPWPFPSQLMLGFFAEYAGGDIAVDGVEIVEADWYAVDELPSIPPPETISGQLILQFVARCQGR